MAKLITQVNRTKGNYQDVFLYTLNASFNGIQDRIEDAQIKVFFPDTLTVYLGDIQEPVVNVTQEIKENGTIYTFNFGSITDTGIAIRVGLGVVFGPSAVSETRVTIEPELWINGSLYIMSTSEPIELQVTPNFMLTHEQISPSIGAAPNGVIYYRVLLKNYGDLGGAIANVDITCNCAEGFIVDPSFVIIGKDVSSNDFTDTAQDGITGTVNNNILNFKIPSFYGEAYQFIYKVLTSENTLVGENYLNQIAWSVDDISQEEILDVTTLSEPIYKTNFSIYGPVYSLPERPINYEMSLTNAGNQDLNSVLLTMIIPEEIDFTTFTTGLFKLYGIDELIDMEYGISYTTIFNKNGTIGSFNTNTNARITISDFISESETLRSLTWELPILPVGFTTQITPLFNGIIKNTIPIGATIQGQLDLEYYANNIASNNETMCITTVQDVCILNPIFSSSIGSNPIRPGETFQYTIGANCRNSRLDTPIFIFFLPANLEYIGNVQSTINDYFEVLTDIAIPEPLVISKFNANLETLIIFKFTDEFAVEFHQKSKLKITFTAQVRAISRGNFSSYFLLDTGNSIGQVASNRETYEDTENVLNIYTENTSNFYARSNTFANVILFFVSVSSRKEVKGILDEEFVPAGELATTLSGEEVYYRVTLTNTGNADLEGIELVDILPYVGDTGVIETSISRGSEFPLILTTEVSATLNSLNEASNATLDFDIFYSESKDPVRFGGSFDTIGSVEDWTDTPPETLSSIHTLRLRTKEASLLPGENISILFKTLVPCGVEENAIAWNSFAADVVYTDTEGIQQHLLAIEPDKVGVKVLAQDESKGRISGFVFWDEEKKGIYNSSSQRTDITNDIGVVLYNSQGIPLRVTFTSATMEGINGQYSFSNLEPSQYYIRFFIETNIHDFSIFSGGLLNHSQANKQGVTQRIDLATNQYRDDIIAGIHSNKERRINELLEVNQSSKQMIRNVIYDQMLIGMKMEDVMNF